MTMTYNPTVREQEAEEFAQNALKLIELAIHQLCWAEAQLLEEEKLHKFVSPTNQGNIGRYTEASNLLEEVWEKITGKPRIQVISSTGTIVRTLADGVVMEHGKH
jgi:hypothetical protein